MAKWPGQKWLEQWMRQWHEPGTRHLSPRELAEQGENLAATHLRRGGLKIIARNFRCEAGEVDIIARDGKVLVFVEVKAREAAESAPETAVDAQKRGRVTGAAKVYLARYGAHPPAVRFDVVAIVWPRGRSPQLRHMPGAFEAEGPKSK